MRLSPETVCVFCGSHDGRGTAYVDGARALGRELARRGYGLVFGGGRTGMMGAVADATLEARGEATGVIPMSMVEADLHHHGLTRLEVVQTMHERKALMVDLAGAFVALPGGMGTFEELLEALTWAQLGIHRKPVGILDLQGYFGGLTTLLDRAVEDGFLGAHHRDRCVLRSDPAELLDALESIDPAGSPPSRLRW